MPIVPRGYVDQAQLASVVEEVRQALSPDVVRIRFDVGEDWIGAPAIFFRVVLSDQASRRPRLRDVTELVSRRVQDQVKPDEMGLQAYFNYRSDSEQREMKEQSWE
ncbi:MAG: hypothetical protein C0504_08690 [Candidatus Solibacter sp.]|nr:hypothetical protein [Candidatus Solibacter sp.]